MAALVLTEDNWNEYIEMTEQLSVVHVMATWCGPCRMLQPIIEELSDQYTGQAIVGFLDVDTSPNIPAKYNIQSLPTILYIKDGEIINRVKGLVSKTKCEGNIKKYIKQ